MVRASGVLGDLVRATSFKATSFKATCYGHAVDSQSVGRGLPRELVIGPTLGAGFWRRLSILAGEFEVGVPAILARSRRSLLREVHRNSRESRRSLSTRPSVWQVGQ